jgi:hypothetical protein
MGIDGKSLCVVCAWRETCRKKFNLPPGEARCPDFSRDVSLSRNDEDGEDRERHSDET